MYYVNIVINYQSESEFSSLSMALLNYIDFGWIICYILLGILGIIACIDKGSSILASGC